MTLKTMTAVTKDGTAEDQLETLAINLAKSIDDCDDAKLIPQLARQYRETIKALNEIKDGDDGEDEIAEITNRRKNRQSRAN